MLYYNNEKLELNQMTQKCTMCRRTMLLLLVYHAVVGVLAIYMILSIWPSGNALTTSRSVSLFGGLIEIDLDGELNLLLIVVFGGITGAFIQSTSSIAHHRSLNDLGEEWSVWYGTRPFVGAGLALALYLLLRGGFLGLGTDPSSMNIFGIAGIAGIAGMFTNQATQKLRDVAETLLKTEKKA